MITVDTFTSRTSLLSALIWNYSTEQRSVLRDRNQKQRLEFKMFSMAFYALNIKEDDSSQLKDIVRKCIEILDMNVNDATYGEPMNAYSNFHIGKEYFTEKLNYYMNDIGTFIKDNGHYPKFCFNSIIKSPLENTDSYFFDSFNHKDYKPEFVQQLKPVLRLMETCLTRPDFYLNKMKEAKDQIKLSVLDPNRDKLIAENLIDRISKEQKIEEPTSIKETPLEELVDNDDLLHNINNVIENNSSPLEKVIKKARAFINEFDNAEFINKLSITVKFIVENTPEIESQKSVLGVNDVLFKDLSDNIYMVANAKVGEIIKLAQSDPTKLKQIFQEKENSGYGKTMWDEYSFLLINNSQWPLTREAKSLWAFTVLDFGQLKFANEKQPDNNNSKGGCYIATMVYGDYDHPQVIELRNYRDDTLLKTHLGRLFVKIYYSVSPSIVTILKRHDKINLFIKRGLDKFINHIKNKNGNI